MIARLAIPELAIDVPVVAYVLPEELTRPLFVPDPSALSVPGGLPDLGKR